MKTKKIVKISLLVVTTASLIQCFNSCTNDDITRNDKREVTTEGTTFISSKATTRTHVKTDYTSKFEYFWDKIYSWGYAGDKISIESTPGTWLESDFGSVKDTDGKVAAFNFSGATLTNPDYMVYYGSETTSSKNIIKIPSDQIVGFDAPKNQLKGDCGVGKAKRTTSGDYVFTLHHKAAYAVVRWYCPNNALITSGKYNYYSVSIYADEPLSGTYKLPDTEDGHLTFISPDISGKQMITSQPQPNQGGVVSSNLDNADPTFFCMAPGTYHNVEVVLNMYDSDNRTLVKMLAASYRSLVFKENELTPLQIKLELPDYSDRNKFYLWGAQNHYWYGYESEQKYDRSRGAHYPQAGDANGRYANLNYGYGSPLVGIPQAMCPNNNETLWYINKGEAIYDARPFIYNGRIMHGIMWFKKKAKIPGFSDSKAPDGVDYRGTPNIPANLSQATATKWYTGDDFTDYFPLPFLGIYKNGEYYNPGVSEYNPNGNSNESSYWINGVNSGGLRIHYPAIAMRDAKISYTFTGDFTFTNWNCGTPLWKAE